jgi:pentapeptide repeat protein
MSEQDNGQVSTLQRPTTTNQEDWHTFWEQQGQPWRWEMEIDEERQKYLNEHRAIVPDTVKGIYPFKGVGLSRADIEWLLATHDNGHGPVDWDRERLPGTLQVRRGLDFRGVDLRGANLSLLPLARLLGGDLMEFGPKTDAQHEAEALHLEGATLVHTHLEGTVLGYSHLEGANLYGAYLEHALLDGTHLEEAMLDTAQLKEAKLWGAHLEKARPLCKL